MTHPMEESNHKGQCKIKHMTRRMKEHFPSCHGNIKHMIHWIEECIPIREDKLRRRRHKIKQHIPSGHDIIKHMTHQMGKINTNGLDKKIT